MSKSTQHLVCVWIETLDPQSLSQARNRVLRWLETFGHTAVNHGFEFTQMSGDTSNRPIETKVVR